MTTTTLTEATNGPLVRELTIPSCANEYGALRKQSAKAILLAGLANIQQAGAGENRIVHVFIKVTDGTEFEKLTSVSARAYIKRAHRRDFGGYLGYRPVEGSPNTILAVLNGPKPSRRRRDRRPR